MDRLRLLCQSILGRNLDVDNVATTLALADQHNCSRLKDVCIEFITSSNEIDAMVATKGYTAAAAMACRRWTPAQRPSFPKY
ncbi:hypothetical protein E2562_027739 [Oryza meyeriana var. granulata]|uniref:BPM/SPOP BACK domain-containing protein n=1 Tax=Oryza meyeriana var. granulata TaxID=110450 RepID=A0A6G1EQM3_9ORYZ|nr:hypothetical protein E2562_027739 [Oryza meyeriana var. granulata]